MLNFKIFFLGSIMYGTIVCHRSESGFMTVETPTSRALSLSRQDGGPLGTGLAGEPPLPPPQNNPVSPFGPGGGPAGISDGFVPFGLNHIILIVIPMFKAKWHNIPSWLTSFIKISMPITVFFDQLNVPPGMFVPGIGGLPLPLPFPPPIGVNPIGPGGPIPPPGPAVPPTTGASPVTISPPTPGYSYEYSQPQPSLYANYGGYDGYGDDAESEHSGIDGESYDTDNYYSEGKKRRWKREIFSNERLHYKARKAQSFVFNESIHVTERAALIPKLENLLENSGFGGKACLLRTICEVHEAPLDHYGLLGELFTMFFSVSRSLFAESHLPEYLRAEVIGKTGDCTDYFRHCDNSIFSWEEVKTSKSNKKKVSQPFIVNDIDEVW